MITGDSAQTAAIIAKYDTNADHRLDFGEFSRLVSELQRFPAHQRPPPAAPGGRGAGMLALEARQDAVGEPGHGRLAEVAKLVARVVEHLLRRGAGLDLRFFVLFSCVWSLRRRRGPVHTLTGGAPRRRRDSISAPKQTTGARTRWFHRKAASARSKRCRAARTSTRRRRSTAPSRRCAPSRAARSSARAYTTKAFCRWSKACTRMPAAAAADADWELPGLLRAFPVR